MQALHRFRPLICLPGILLLGLLWAGCRTATGNGPAADGSDKLLKIYCYYSGDEKYQADQDEMDQGAWLRQFVSEVHGSPADFDHYDLFTHQGGGPAGAEWNSDGAILVLCRIALPSNQVGEVEIALNGESLSPPNFRGITVRGTIVFFEIAADQWLSRLKPVKKKNFPLIYDSDAIENLKNQPGSPLGVGEIMKVQVEAERLTDGKSKSLKATKAFHRAAGE